MERFFKKLLSRRGVLALLPALVLGLARQGSAQNTAVTSYNSLVDALRAGVTTITNFGTNSTLAAPVQISYLTSVSTIQITNNVTIDGGTNFVLFQGNGEGRLFYVHPNASLTLNHLELTGGQSTNGGAVYNAGTLIISNCLLAGNDATNSDGADGGSGPPDLDSNGTNGGDGGLAEGGAIYSTGPVMISYSILSNNFAQAGNGGNGGNAGGQDGNGGNAGYGGDAYGGALFSSGSNNVIYMTEFFGNECIAGNGGTGGSYATPEGFGGVAGLGGSGAGGAACIAGPLYMTNCLFSNNIASGGSTGAAEVDSDGGGADGSPGGSAVGACLFITNGVADAGIVNTIFYFNACYGGNGGNTALIAAIGGDGGAALGGGVWSGAVLTRMSFCTLATNYLNTINGAGGLNTAGGTSGKPGATNGSDIFQSLGVGVFDLSASILSGDGYPNLPNAFAVTDAGYNVVSDASLTRSIIITTTRLNTKADLDAGLFPSPTYVGGPFGLPMLTLGIADDSPAGDFVPGVPGSTFPATDEALQPRQTPTSAGAYEINPADIQTNAQLPTIVSTLPLTNLTGTGGSVAFTTAVTTQYESSVNTNFGYQWQLDGTNISDNANFSGTTSNILTVKKVTIADQGEYTVLVSPTLLEGAVTSSVVELILTNPPVIETQPVSQLSRPVGSIVTFTLGVASPLNFNYQWRYSNSSVTNYLTNGGNITGANSNILTIDPALTNDSGYYAAIVTNAYGAKTSTVVRLTVVPDHTRPTVTVTSPPANVRTNNTLVINGTASDNAQVTNVLFWITNINAGLTPVTNMQAGNAILTTNGSTNLNGPNTMLWSITNTLLPGTNILVVQSVDYSSNVSTRLIQHIFYQVPSVLTLTSNLSEGGGTLTGHASVTGDTVPLNAALLNIGEGYSIVAAPNSTSLLGRWTITNSSVAAVVVTNGNTLKFIMESNMDIQALFVSNAFLQAGVHGTYNGLFYVPPDDGTNEVAFESSGMLSHLVVGNQGSFSGRLLLTGDSYILSGSFDAFGHVTNYSVARTKELGPLLLDMDLDTNGAGIITGAVSNAAWPTNAYLWAGLAATTGTTNFTLLMAPPTNAPTNVASPPGDGYALIADHAGTVTLSGGLADGTTFSQSVPASISNDVPVYVSLYDQTGFLFGWLNLTNLDNTNAADELMWIKGVPAHPTLLFSNGFTNLLPTIGSVWTNPGAITLSPTNTLAISNVNLDLNYTLAVSDKYKLVATNPSPTNSLTGTINLANGLLQVTFGNGDGRATTLGYGAMLQNSTNAAGYFVTKTNAGSIILSGSGQPFSFPQASQTVEELIDGNRPPPPPPLPPPLEEQSGGAGSNSPPPQ
jgi:hypothetical protein